MPKTSEHQNLINCCCAASYNIFKSTRVTQHNSKQKHPSDNKKTIPHCGCRLFLPELDVIVIMIYTALVPLELGGMLHLKPSFSLGQKILSTHYWGTVADLSSVNQLPPFCTFRRFGRWSETGSSDGSNKSEKKETRSVNLMNSEKIPLDYHWIVALNYLILACSIPEKSRRLIVASLAVSAHSSQAFHRCPS